MHNIYEEFENYDGAAVFDDWSSFIEKCNNIPNGTDVKTACETMNLSLSFYTKVVDHAFANWRDSTSTSTLHGISHLTLGKNHK
jgi:hypothetical protein